MVTTRKRKQDVVEDAGSDSEFAVSGLLDIDSDDEGSGDEDGGKDNEEEVDEEEEDKEEEEEQENEDEDDSEEDELNRILAEEEDEDDDEEEDEDDDENSDQDSLSGASLSTAHTEEYVTTYSDGKPRVIRPEIEPTYDLDDSDAEDYNTIGNVPLSAYDEMPHLGYDINGRRIMRPAKGSALQQLLDQIELPEGWTGLLDQNTGEALKVTPEELELIRKIQHNENTADIDPYTPTVEWFTSKTEVMPLTAVPEPKRRFAPSRHEARTIMKLVRAIREGKIVPGKKKDEEEEEHNYDLWTQDGAEDNIMTLRAPKLSPPTHDELYNPPSEYLFSEEEKQKWLETAPADREVSHMPQQYLALRKVPAYLESVRERFERCLDLYLAPRVRHRRIDVDPDLLIPELPSPKDLRPFPVRCSTIYKGHTGRVRSVSVHVSGLWLATGSDDGTVRVWEVLSGRQVWQYNAVDDEDDRVDVVAWHPDASTPILAVAAAERVVLLVPPLFGFEAENAAREKVESGWGYATHGNKTEGDMLEDEEKEDANSTVASTSVTTSGGASVAQWLPPSSSQSQNGVAAIIECRSTVKTLAWHRKGDYFVTCAPASNNTAVLVHQLSKHWLQLPFRRNRGIIVDARFHPSRPQLFVSSQRTVRIYDLAQQTLVKKLMPGARMLLTISIHPRGDHLLAASYDKRVLWHDLDLGATPYKTLRYHEKAVRSVGFHDRLPLFCSASDDGSIHVFHATVYDDLMTNPLLVPLKKLLGHRVVDSVGVLNVAWHPREAWLFSGGADGTARLWTT